MITLASSSPTRANLLKNAGIEFKQISCSFDESMIAKNLRPEIYVQNVVKAKKEQFLMANGKLTNLLFADSCVACGDKILGKAKDENEALAMLNLQSGNECSVYTAMIFLGEFELINVSKTTYKFCSPCFYCCNYRHNSTSFFSLFYLKTIIRHLIFFIPRN